MYEENKNQMAALNVTSRLSRYLPCNNDVLTNMSLRCSVVCVRESCVLKPPCKTESNTHPKRFWTPFSTMNELKAQQYTVEKP